MDMTRQLMKIKEITQIRARARNVAIVAMPLFVYGDGVECE